jgi:chitinase
VIGYYGNAGLAVSSIPTLDQVDGNYNVIILTFASIALNGTFSLDGQIQGPYAGYLDVLKRDIAAWKKGTDKYGRRRCVLVSIGGQNGRWPAGVASATLLAGAKAFFAEYGIDGLDLDLEGVYMYVCVCAQRACACVSMSDVTKGGGGPTGMVV